jgi:hypothetical protein
MYRTIVRVDKKDSMYPQGRYVYKKIGTCLENWFISGSFACCFGDFLSSPLGTLRTGWYLGFLLAGGGFLVSPAIASLRPPSLVSTSSSRCFGRKNMVHGERGRHIPVARALYLLL